MADEHPDTTTPSTDGVASIVLTGEIDASNAADITSSVGDALSGGASSVVVDLAGVTFFDSTALGALIAAHNECVGKDVALLIRDPSPQVRRILELTATASLFPLAE